MSGQEFPKPRCTVAAIVVDFLIVVVVVVFVVVETWRLGPLEKGFPSKRYHAARVGGKNRERWGWFAEQFLSQCYSVWTPLQPVFYGLRLLSATRAFEVDCRVELIGVGLKEGGVAGS